MHSLDLVWNWIKPVGYTKLFYISTWYLQLFLYANTIPSLSELYLFWPQQNKYSPHCSGPLFYKGWYHFFYQYNPNAAVWGDIVWGHAVSKDLIHWVHLPLAMVADQWYDANGVWTGSATFLEDGSIVMLYTGSTDKSVQVCNTQIVFRVYIHV